MVGLLLLCQQFQNDDGHDGGREDGRERLEDRAHTGLGLRRHGMSGTWNRAGGTLRGADSGERALAHLRVQKVPAV